MLAISCATFPTANDTNENTYPVFYEEQPPLTILIMPPINQTSSVEAKDYFYYTLHSTISNMGYYSFPPLLSMETLQTESAYDSEIFIEGNISKFKETFGADLLLFTKITKWDKNALLSNVEVSITYILRSTTTGEVVYSRKGTFNCSTKVNTGLSNIAGLELIGTVVDSVASLTKTVLTDYTKVATVCNQYSLDFPYGKYNPNYMLDKTRIIGQNPFFLSGSIDSVSDNYRYNIPIE